MAETRSSDPLLDVLHAEVNLHGGRPRRKPMYNNGTTRKHADGTATDEPPEAHESEAEDAGSEYDCLIFEKTELGWSTRFEPGD